ncbi:MAG: hypothetical protein Q8P67_29330 [archaeon]|nr:hypothetical protein [archaeon]
MLDLLWQHPGRLLGVAAAAAAVWLLTKQHQVGFCICRRIENVRRSPALAEQISDLVLDPARYHSLLGGGWRLAVRDVCREEEPSAVVGSRYANTRIRYTLRAEPPGSTGGAEESACDRARMVVPFRRGLCDTQANAMLAVRVWDALCSDVGNEHMLKPKAIAAVADLGLRQVAKEGFSGEQDVTPLFSVLEQTCWRRPAWGLSTNVHVMDSDVDRTAVHAYCCFTIKAPLLVSLFVKRRCASDLLSRMDHLKHRFEQPFSS